jgi:transposase
MPSIPTLTDAEWKQIEAVLPRFKAGRPRQNDRLVIAGFLYAVAAGVSIDALPEAYGNPRSRRTKWQRWRQDGTWDRILRAGKSATERIHKEYHRQIREASFTPRLPGEKHPEHWPRWSWVRGR